jgi:glycyl-tRNA synthetase alpha subunit
MDLGLDNNMVNNIENTKSMSVKKRKRYMKRVSHFQSMTGKVLKSNVKGQNSFSFKRGF